MPLWIFSNFSPLNLLLVLNQQAEKIIEKRFVQGCNNVTRAQIEPRLYEEGRFNNDTLTFQPRLQPKTKSKRR